MKSLSYGTMPGEQYPETGALLSWPIAGEIQRRVIAVLMARQLFSGITFIEKRFYGKIGGTEQTIRQSVFLLFAGQDVRLEGMLRAWGQGYADSFALLPDRLEGIARVCVGSFEN